MGLLFSLTQEYFRDQLKYLILLWAGITGKRVAIQHKSPSSVPGDSRWSASQSKMQSELKRRLHA